MIHYCSKCGQAMHFDVAYEDCEIWICFNCGEVDVDPIVPDIEEEYE